MSVSEATYRQVALEDPHGKWELVCGRLRQKPPMTSPHEETSFRLPFLLQVQLEGQPFHVRHDQSRLRVQTGSYYVPDVFVVPAEALPPGWQTSEELEVFDRPLPFVAEVWSRSTGDYDASEKLAEYRRRGDLEVWLVHPYERTVTAWRRQPDGGYAEHAFPGGRVTIGPLPGVSIDLDSLFRR